jgi:hypothetical protein
MSTRLHDVTPLDSIPSRHQYETLNSHRPYTEQQFLQYRPTASNLANGFHLNFDSVFLGAFAKLRKVTISFVMSVRSTVCNNSAPTERILINLISEFFQNCIEKIQVSLKSDKNNGYFTRRRLHIYDNISLIYS